MSNEISTIIRHKKGKLSTCEHRSGRPSPSRSELGQTHFSVVWGSLHLLHNEPVTFPALPVPIYTPGLRGVIMVKCLTQGHNTLTVTGLEPTTFCLWIQHWSARPHAPTLAIRHSKNLIDIINIFLQKPNVNGWQLAKMKKSIPDMSLPWNL